MAYRSRSLTLTSYLPPSVDTIQAGLPCWFTKITDPSELTVMILSFWTDMPRQTLQTQSSLFRVYTVCHSVCIVWTHYSMVQPHSSNFRVITTNFLGVRIFKKFTVQSYTSLQIFSFSVTCIYIFQQSCYKQ